MSYPSATSSLETYKGSSDDDEETPRANRTPSNPFMAYCPPPPQTDPPRAIEAPINYYNDEFEEEDRRWNAEQSLMRHLQPTGSEGSEYGRRSPSPVYHRRRRWWDFEEINTLDDFTACVGIWSLACMTAIVIVGGAAVIWVLVT